MESQKSFFNQFGEFVRSLEADLCYLKSKFDLPSGNHPENYNRGLKVIQTEIHDLKLLGEEMKGKISEVQQFGSFVQSLQEMIGDHQDDLIKMESYLEKYGYKVPDELLQKSEESISETDDSETVTKDGHLECLVEELEEKCSLKTEPLGLREANQKRLIDKDTPIVSKSFRSHNITEEEVDKGNVDHLMNHSSSPELESNYSSPDLNLYKLKGKVFGRDYVSEKSQDVTPVVLPSNRPGTCLRERGLMLQGIRKFPSFDEKVRSGNVSLEENKNVNSIRSVMSRQKSASTPEEPEMSYSTSKLLTLEKKKSHTPEEPTLSLIHSLQEIKAQSGNQHTPEEPLLFPVSKTILDRHSEFSENTKFLKVDTATPEESILTFQMQKAHLNSRDNCVTPKIAESNAHSFEPVSPELSDITLQFLNVKRSRYSDETNSPAQIKKEVCNIGKKIEDMPQSPEMSDETIKILNIRF